VAARVVIPVVVPVLQGMLILVEVVEVVDVLVLVM
jgi:hypothetical protein